MTMFFMCWKLLCSIFFPPAAPCLLTFREGDYADTVKDSDMNKVWYEYQQWVYVYFYV